MTFLKTASFRLFIKFYKAFVNDFFLVYSSIFVKYSQSAVLKGNFELNGYFLINGLIKRAK